MASDGRVNILLVDDQPGKLLSYEVILSELGETLIKAQSASEALGYLLKHEIAVVLIDVVMPELDGFQLAAMIREHPRFQKTAIIFVSAVQFADVDHLRGYEIGAVDYVSVPVVPEVLRAKVKVFVELYRKTRELERLNDELERRVAERTAELEASNKRLREAEARRTLALTAGDMGSWSLDIETGQYTWDEGQYRIFGVDPNTFEPTWKEIRALHHPEDREQLPVAVKARGLTERYQHEFRVVRPNGDVRWCFGSVAPTFDENGTTVRLSGVTVDITDRKRAEERQALLAREVDHRAKNALAVVQSILRLSRAKTTPEFVRVVEGRIRALAATHNLLSSTRWEGANLAEIVEEESAPYRLQHEDRIVTRGPAILLRPSTAQAMALALHELATNAAKYGALSHPGGRLNLTWSFKKDLELEWIERDGPATAEPSTLGFGLTIVRSSIEHQLGGTVRCEWAPTGLICRMSIPGRQVVQPETAPTAGETAAVAPEPPAADGTITGRRILVVEDEALISMFIENVLEDMGAQVVGPVNSLAEGLAVAGREQLDGAILDLNLGGEQTYPLADALSARGVPFVFITGYDRDALDRRYVRVPVLQKPIEADALERVLVNDFARAVA